ncbi:MAG: SDR family oxidoreductase [Leptospiraceae bacterium]|nr:SDR family oxidoreductase [Leptospiraceae bacterium]MCP5495624.1 SDR family oxidoreductase [Leptospiraceae bacterium]
MEKVLKNKTAIVTGGSLGIGKETCLLLAEKGANVIVADINEEEGNHTTAEIRSAGGNAIFVFCDVSKEEQIESLCHQAKEFGRLDIFVSNAGVGGKPDYMHRLSTDEWNRLLLIDLTSVFWCHKYAVNSMLADKEGGVVVNISSAAGLGASPTLGGYAVAKAGVIELSLTAAVELATKNIRINVVCPGWTETAIIGFAGNRGKESMKKQIPMGRLGTTQEIASLIVFLASPESSFITGSVFRADGGLRS